MIEILFLRVNDLFYETESIKIESYWPLKHYNTNQILEKFHKFKIVSCPYSNEEFYGILSSHLGFGCSISCFRFVHYSKERLVKGWT